MIPGDERAATAEDPEHERYSWREIAAGIGIVEPSEQLASTREHDC